MNGIKCCLVGVVALVGTSARAETVAWYRFDECAPGTLTTADSRCLNAVDPTKCVGTFHVWNGNSSAYWNPPSVKTTPAEWMPTYDQGFGEYVGVRDPVSGLTQGNAASLRLAVSDPTVAMGVNLRAGLLMIEDDAILHSSSFTVEFFMKMPKCRITGGSYIIAQKGGVFSIGMSNDRWMTASVTTDSGSASITHRNYSGVDNDKWAHIALVANDETKKLTLYINGYGSSADYTGTVSDTAGKPMTFGGSPTSYVGVWDGRIAEVRVSNVALAPAQFLTFASHAPTSALTAPETLFFGDFNGGLDSVRFEDCYQNFAFSYRPSFLNRAASRADFPIASATLTWTSGQTATAETRELTGNVPAAAIRAGLVPTNGVEDAVALHFGTNAANPTASIPRLDINDPTRMIVSDSFTMEFFLKVGPGQICHDGSYTAYVVYQVNTLVLQMEENGCVAFSDGAGRKMYFPVAWNDSHDRTNLRYNDGAWHHYALVYDKDASRLDLYIDYARKGYLEDPKLCEDFTDQPQYRQLSFLWLLLQRSPPLPGCDDRRAAHHARGASGLALPHDASHRGGCARVRLV